MSFIEKFFGYSKNADGVPVSYSDGNGAGSFADWRHFAWMVASVVLCVVLYKIFAKHKKAGKITVWVLCGAMFATRVINQTVRAAIGAEVPWTRAFPFHMCTVMSFALPIMVLLVYLLPKNKVVPYFQHAVYVLSMFGGIITIIMGDYFGDLFMTFSTLEGIAAHTILLCVPIIEIAMGNFNLNVRRSWTVIAGMLLLIGWASIANFVFFTNYDPNYMYLRKNGLPGNLGGDYYFLIYTAIFFVMFGLTYGIPMLYRKLRSRRTAAQ